MQCFYHPMAPAEHECGICHHPVCGKCRMEVQGQRRCESCVRAMLGLTPHSKPPRNYSRAMRAAFLSAMLPGLGQFYNLEFAKGVIYFAGSIACFSLGLMNPITYVLIMLVYLLSLYDAFISAQ